MRRILLPCGRLRDLKNQMAYTLQALIADEAVLATAVPTDAVVVRLPQGKAMIPLSETMRERHGIPFLPLTNEGLSPVVPEGVVSIAEAITKAGKVVYVEAEFFGAGRTQACVTWDAVGQASSPLVDGSAIETTQYST